jgi:capsular exopolysaccharide synthesis family protein
VLVTGVAMVDALRQPDEYVASATLLFRDTNLDEQLLGRDAGGIVDPERKAATNAQLVSLGTIAQRVSERLDGRLDAPTIAASIAVENAPGSDLVTVRARTTDARRASTIANLYAREFVDFQREADRGDLLDAQRLILSDLDQLSPEERDGERGRELRNAAAQLTSLAAVQTGGVRVVEEALPPAAPSYPQPKRTAVVGVVAGLALGAALIFLLELLDNRVKTREDAESALGLPALAVIPSGSGTAPDPAAEGGPHPGAEGFQSLRAALRYLAVEYPIRSVLVTSAAAGDGKSSVSWGLAVAAAQSGQKTLLIEADLRRPTLAARRDLPDAGGLADVLVGEVRVQEAIVRTPMLHFLPAGGRPPFPLQLLESARMQDLLTDLRRDYDLVVVDTPPLGVVADAIPLTQAVDGVLVVARCDHTPRTALRSLQDRLDQVNAPTLGVVVNDAKVEASAYHYA